jgi:hypothetical protein
LEVFKLHTEHNSAETAERRKRKVEDVQKRAEYRKAHGLEGGEGFGGWTARTNAESLGPSIPVGEKIAAAAIAGSTGEAHAVVGEVVHKDQEESKPPAKKWLGIW